MSVAQAKAGCLCEKTAKIDLGGISENHQGRQRMSVRFTMNSDLVLT